MQQLIRPVFIDEIRNVWYAEKQIFPPLYPAYVSTIWKYSVLRHFITKRNFITEDVSI